MPEAFSDSLSMFHIVIFLARSRCTRARGRPQINRPYLPDGCVNSNLVHKFPQHVFLLLISVQRLQAARAVQRSQALQLIRAVCCIWCDAVCCCPGIRGIFTALLALVRWARPPRSVYAAKWALALIVLRLLKCYDKHILVFLLFWLLCSIVLCMPILLTLSGRHPHYPSFIRHFKRRRAWSGWTDPETQTENKGTLRSLFWLDGNQKQGGNGKIRREET